MQDHQEEQPRDARHIDLNDPGAVDHWTRKWGITAEQLQASVRAVGTSTNKVAEHLQIGKQG